MKLTEYAVGDLGLMIAEQAVRIRMLEELTEVQQRMMGEQACITFCLKQELASLKDEKFNEEAPPGFAEWLLVNGNGSHSSSLFSGEERD